MNPLDGRNLTEDEAAELAETEILMLLGGTRPSAGFDLEAALGYIKQKSQPKAVFLFKKLDKAELFYDRTHYWRCRMACLNEGSFVYKAELKRWRAEVDELEAMEW